MQPNPSVSQEIFKYLDQETRAIRSDPLVLTKLRSKSSLKGGRAKLKVRLNSLEKSQIEQRLMQPFTPELSTINLN